jgi:hypothetical protein
MQPQGAPMLGYCCVLCHRFMQTLANSRVAGIPQWPVLPYSPLRANGESRVGVAAPYRHSQFYRVIYAVW